MGFQKDHKLNLGNQYAKGSKHTEEWKKYASERMKGNTHGFVKGKESPRKGKRSDIPAWNKCKKMPEISGARHHNWKGGTSMRDIHSLNNPKYKAWRTEVFTRDDFKCKIANRNCLGGLQAHHILRWADYPELRYEVNNGIVLCKFHHPRKKVEEKKLIPTFLEILDLDISHLNWNEKMD